MPKNNQLVQHRDHTGDAHPKEKACPYGSVLRVLKNWEERDSNRGDSKNGDETEVDITEEWVAHE